MGVDYELPASTLEKSYQVLALHRMDSTDDVKCRDILIWGRKSASCQEILVVGANPRLAANRRFARRVGPRSSWRSV